MTKAKIETHPTVVAARAEMPESGKITIKLWSTIIFTAPVILIVA